MPEACDATDPGDVRALQNRYDRAMVRVVAVALFLLVPLPAGAQYRVITATGLPTPDGADTYVMPLQASIDDNGDVAFQDGSGGSIYVARSDGIELIAAQGQAAPGGGTITSLGVLSSEHEPVNLRGQWLLFTATVDAGVRLLGWNAGSLVRLPGEGDPAPGGGTLGRILENRVTSEGGESLLVAEGALYAVSATGMLTPILAPGDPPPGILAMVYEVAVIDSYPQIADDGDITIGVELEDPTGTEPRRSAIFHGRPGRFTLVEPGILATGDLWQDGVPDVGANRAGIDAFQATVQPETGSPRSGIFAGAPGGEAMVVALPFAVEGGEVTGLLRRPVVGAMTSFAAVAALSAGGTGVLWYDGAGGARLPVRSGEGVDDRPDVSVETIDFVAVGGPAGAQRVAINATCNQGGASLPCLVVHDVATGRTGAPVVAGDTIDLGEPGEVVVESVGMILPLGGGYARPMNDAGELVFGILYDGGDTAVLLEGSAGSRPVADLSISIRLANVREEPPPFVGTDCLGDQRVDLVVEVRNEGPDPADDVEVVIDHRVDQRIFGEGCPSSSVFFDLRGVAACAREMPFAGPVTCSIATIDAGASVTQVVPFVAYPGDYTILASVSSAAEDRDPTDDRAETTISVAARAPKECGCAAASPSSGGLALLVLAFLLSSAGRRRCWRRPRRGAPAR
jgi:hypothetical protein